MHAAAILKIASPENQTIVFSPPFQTILDILINNHIHYIAHEEYRLENRGLLALFANHNDLQHLTNIQKILDQHHWQYEIAYLAHALHWQTSHPTHSTSQ